MGKSLNLTAKKSVKQLLQEIRHWQASAAKGLRVIAWNVAQIIRQLMSEGMTKGEAMQYVEDNSNLSKPTIQCLPRAIEAFVDLTDEELSCLGLSVLCLFGRKNVNPKAIKWAKNMARNGKAVTINRALNVLLKTGSIKIRPQRIYRYTFSFPVPGKSDVHVTVTSRQSMTNQIIIDALYNALVYEGVAIKPIKKAA